MLRYVPSTPYLLRVFIMKGCCILSKDIFCIYWDDHVIVIFYLGDIDLYMLNCPCIPRRNPTWSWCIFLGCSWIRFANILRIFASISIVWYKYVYIHFLLVSVCLENYLPYFPWEPKWVSCRKQIVGSFYILSEILCFLIGEFNPFTFRMIDM